MLFKVTVLDTVETVSSHSQIIDTDQSICLVREGEKKVPGGEKSLKLEGG